MTSRTAVLDTTALIDQKFAPVAMANRQLLPVPGPLDPLFPSGGLQLGWSIGVTGHGGWSLAMALIGTSLGGEAGVSSDVASSTAGTSGDGDGWVACVGLEDFGLVAADEVGLRLGRVLMVESPGREHLATVIAALIEAVDVVCLGPTPSIGIRDARRLMARAREQNAVLFHLDGGRSWPQPLDVNLSVEVGSWSGIGQGHGRLLTRSMSVTATGRRSMAKPRHVEILLPGVNGGVEAAPVHEESGEKVGEWLASA